MEDLTSISDKLLELEGFAAAGLLNDQGVCLHVIGPERRKLEASAAHCATLWRAKRELLAAMRLGEKVDDVLLLIDGYCQILRPWRGEPALFLYVLFARSGNNPAMLRLALASVFQ